MQVWGRGVHGCLLSAALRLTHSAVCQPKLTAGTYPLQVPTHSAHSAQCSLQVPTHPCAFMLSNSVVCNHSIAVTSSSAGPGPSQHSNPHWNLPHTSPSHTLHDISTRLYSTYICHQLRRSPAFTCNAPHLTESALCHVAQTRLACTTETRQGGHLGQPHHL